MDVRVEGDRVVKRASAPADLERLEREASVLAGAAHPGVVRLIGRGPGTLELGRITGPTLTEVGPQPLEMVAGWGAALATTVADLHEIGCTHGAIEEDHVLFDEAGRPVLCGFGSATGPGDPSGEARAGADVAALARVIAGRLPSTASKRLSRALARASVPRAAAGRWGSRPNARTIARILVEQVPDARLAAEPAAARPTGRRATAASGLRVKRRLALGVVAAVLTIGVALVGWVELGHGTAAPTYHPVGILLSAGLTYEVRAPSGEVTTSVVGDWSCRATAQVAVLDRHSGDVWVFDRWPLAGKTVAGHLVERVPGATALEGAKAGPGCEHLIVLRGRSG